MLVVPLLQSLWEQDTSKVDQSLTTYAQAFQVVADCCPDLMGKNPKDQADCFELSMTAKKFEKGLIGANEEKTQTLQEVDAFLADKTFAVSNYFSVADVYLYCILHTSVAKMGSAERLQFANVTRYFDLIQNIIHFELKRGSNPLPLRFVQIEVDTPFVPRPPEEKKKKETKDSDKKEGKAAKVSDEKKKKTETKKDGETKKETAPAKKEAKKEVKKEATAPAPVTPARIDLRVGKVLDVKKHPDADSLYVEEIDVGEEKPRQVVSGLVKHISEQDFKGRMVVLVCNLKPAKMRGVESQAMVLCASNEDKVELVKPPADAIPGDKLFFEGFQGTPDGQLKSKEKVWETVQPCFKTTAKKEAAYIDPSNGKECTLKTPKGGVCSVDSIVGGSMK